MSSYPVLRKASQVFCALVLAVSLTFVSPATSLADEPTATNDSISIIFTNDVHCAIDAVHDEGKTPCLGYAGVGAVVEAAEAEHGAENVTLVDVGDAIQGGPVGTLTEGEGIVDIMNAMGYDYAVPGNHEFDYGMDRFNELRALSSAKYLSCNFVDASENTVLAPYTITTYEGVSDGTENVADAGVADGASGNTASGVDGVAEGASNDGQSVHVADGNNSSAADGVLKVAYVGITTPESLTKSSPINFQDENGNYIYGFCQDSTGEALYAAVQNAVNDAIAEGADYVIAVGHLGNLGITQHWSSEAVIANTTGIDAFIDGHSHETYNTTATNKAGKSVPLAQTGTKLANVGEITITPGAEEEISVDLTSAVECTATSQTVQEKVDAINAEFNEQLQEIVGKSEVDLLSEDAETLLYVRWQETNLGDFVADAFRSTLNTDISFINGGGVRGSILKGEVTYYDLLSVQPFGNELCVVEATGQQIKDALELGVRELPEHSGGFLQVSGLTFKVNNAIESSVKVDENENFVSVDGDYRVYDVKVNGQPLDLDRTYTVGSIDYLLLEGGSGMTMFADCPVLCESVKLDNQAIIEYMESLGGTIGQQYANPEGDGRIVFTNGFVTDPETDPDEGNKNPEVIPTDNENPEDTNGSSNAEKPATELAETSDNLSVFVVASLAGLALVSAAIAGRAMREKNN